MAVIFADATTVAGNALSRSSHTGQPPARARADAPFIGDVAGEPAEEISFLAALGFPLEALAEAGEHGRRLGVCSAKALISSGAIAESDFYQALAKTLHAPFVAAPPGLAGMPARPLENGAPIARLADRDRYLMAPEGEALRRLLRRWRDGRLPTDRLAITTPGRLAAWTRAASARAVARAACDELRRHDPSLCAASPPRIRARAVLGLTLVLCVAALAVGGLARLAMCSAVGALASIAIAIRLRAVLASFKPPSRPSRYLSDMELPIYTVIVALYREARVVARLAQALDSFDYPASKVDFKFVVEEGDHETMEAIEALSLPPNYEIVVAPAGAPRTKPRALNVALARARGSLIAVFDAEDSPDPGQLRLAAERFAAADARLGCLQARIAIDNPADSWLAALFAIEYAGLFDVLNPGIAAIGAPMMLGGTSNHFRAAVLRQLRGWDAWNVTEDADLGLRLARFGYRVETIASTTHEEAPARVEAWLAQRRRWIKGWMQTLSVHTRDPRRLWMELGTGGALSAIALLTSGVAGPLLTPVFIALMVHDIADGEYFAEGSGVAAAWTGLAAAGAVSILLPCLVGAKRRGLLAETRCLLLLPAYYALLSFAAWRALWELWRRPFAWSKTEHGLARTSRRGPSVALARPRAAPALARVAAKTH